MLRKKIMTYGIGNPDPILVVMVMVLNIIFNNISATYIMAASFIDGGNRSTLRKPPTCHKSLTKLLITPSNVQVIYIS
jgi:hypothetical protein